MNAWWGWVGFNRGPEPEPDPNPLCLGDHCESCGVFLDKPERPCPLGCK